MDIRRNVLTVKGIRGDGLYEYEIAPMLEDMETYTKSILSNPEKEFLKVKCGDSRMEENSILLSCLLYNARGPAHTFAGGSGIPSRLISELSTPPEEHKEGFLEDVEIVAKSSWINYAKYKKIFSCSGAIFLEHSDCHGWSNVVFENSEEEEDLHLQAAIALASQKGEKFENLDEFFIVYVQFKGRQIVKIDIYYLVFN